MARKRRRPKSSGTPQARPDRPLAARDHLREALGELQEPEWQKRQQRRQKARHTDEYREISLDGGKAQEFSGALLELTRKSYEDRERLAPEEARRTNLLRWRRGGPRSRRDIQREASRAAGEMKEEMDREGVPEPTHYYRPRERAETGEVDRTYDVDTGEEEREA